jgi:subtilase family serine protease
MFCIRREKMDMEPFFQIAQFTAQPSASAPQQAFSGTQLLSLYGIPAIRPALGATRRASIAIVVAHSYANLRADLQLYWQSAANFGSTIACPLVTVHTMPGAGFDVQWAQEACLDLQMACTANPHARVLVVEATSASLGDMLAAVDYASAHADVVSMSWGANDAAAFAPYASRFSREHVSFVAASGDTNVASWPSVVDTCVSVGGTTLLWAPCQTRLRSLMTPYARSEFTWPSAGCGYSMSVARPAYQSSVNATAARVIPDLSLVANPRSGAYIVYNGNWLVFGGTSLATPLFAGMISLANQMRLNIGKQPLSTQNGELHSILYAIYTDPRKYAAAFKDITLGTNAGSSLSAGSLAEYTEGTGFRIPTGLGSPNCARLCAELAAAP